MKLIRCFGSSYKCVECAVIDGFHWFSSFFIRLQLQKFVKHYESHGSLCIRCLIAFRSIQRKYATGRPDQKDLNENLAATQGLAHMIAECNHLFEVQDAFSVMFGMRCVCIEKLWLFTYDCVQNKYKSFS